MGRQRAHQAPPGVSSVPESQTIATETLKQSQQNNAWVRSPRPHRSAALGTPPASSLRAW
eukprot:5394867-Lingulodinium_polyedra.AAC.1